MVGYFGQLSFCFCSDQVSRYILLSFTILSQRQEIYLHRGTKLFTLLVEPKFLFVTKDNIFKILLFTPKMQPLQFLEKKKEKNLGKIEAIVLQKSRWIISK